MARSNTMPSADLPPTAEASSAEGLGEADSAQLKQRFFRKKAEDSLPVAFTHERIYILPTRRGWLFLLSLLVMLITSMNYALGLGYALSFLLCGLFSSALLATYRNLAGTVFENVHAGSATVGEDVAFSLTVKNPSKQALRMLRIKNTTAQETVVETIAGGQSITTTLKVPALKRGWMACGRLTFTSEYPLGLWYSWGYAHVPCYTLVYPLAESDAPALPVAAGKQSDDIGDASGPELAASSGDPSAIREYRPGDNIVAIDWKASARGQGLHTREFAEQEEPDKLWLTWDQTSDLADVEARLARLTAWVHICSENGHEWNLELPGNASNQSEALHPESHPASGRGYSEQLKQSLEMLAMYGLPVPANPQNAANQAKGRAA